MAATAEASRLTEAHRLAQLRLGAATVRRLFAVWPLLDTSNLDATFQRWLQGVTAVVTVQRAQSANLAAGYLQTFRTLELGVDIPPIAATLADTVEPKALATSMLVTGPASIRAALARGIPYTKAADTAQAGSAAAGMRHALNGGRDTILATIAADRHAKGWARATSGRPCAYCQSKSGELLSSSQVFEAHDHCACTAEPVYRRDAALPPVAAAVLAR